MTRQSTNQLDAQGALVNGFDYDLQAWVKDGIVQRCGHPGTSCQCAGRIYEGKTIEEARLAAGVES